MELIKGDIHQVIKSIEENSIDLIYTNPPFGSTENKWDIPLDWDYLWPEIWRVLKPNGVAVIHASKPFSYKLFRSQMPKYNYTWVKDRSTHFFHAKKQPLRKCEEVYIFYKKAHTYNPQMVGNKLNFEHSAGKNSSKYYGNRTCGKPSGRTYRGKYPTDYLNYKRQVRGGKTIPDEMIEFFIKTYSNEGDTILDLTTHNKVVATVVTNLKRKFIGVDLNIDI